MEKTIILSLKEYKEINEKLENSKGNKICLSYINYFSGFFSENCTYYEKDEFLEKILLENKELKQELQYNKNKTFLQKLKDLF